MPLFARTLQGRLYGLVALAFLPSVFLFIYAHVELSDLARQLHERELLRMARTAASDYGRVVEETRGLLSGLASIEAVREMEKPGCDRILANVLEGMPLYTSLAVIDRNGYRACGALSLEDPIYVGDRSYLERARLTGAFAVGEYQIGRITGIPTLGLASPLEDAEGRVDGYISTSIDLTRLAERAPTDRLPAEASFTVVDRSGRVLVRQPEGPAWLGRELPAELRDAILGVDIDTVLTVEESEGFTGRLAVSHLIGGGAEPEGYVTVGVPNVAGAATIGSIFRRDLAILAALALLALVAAWWLGHESILQRINAIVDAEKRLAAGDLSARTGLDYGDDELSRIARAFDEMAATVEERERPGE